MINDMSSLNDERLRGFDAEWYMKTYPDVAASGLDPAQHYLLCGIPLGRAKGPESVSASQNTDQRLPKNVAALFGRVEAETVPKLAQTPDAAIIATPPGLGLRPVFGGKDGPLRGPRIGLPALFMGEVELGRSHDVAALSALAGPVRMLNRMLHGQRAGTVRINPAEPTQNGGALPAAQDEAVSLGALVSPAFLSGAAQIGNAWFSATATLRVMLKGNKSEAVNGGACTIRAWQADARSPGDLLHVGGADLPETDPGFVELALSNPLMPVLFEASDSNGFTLGFALLAFPSLLWGGFHAAERAAHQQGPDPMGEVWRQSTALLRDLLAGPQESEFAVARLAVRLDRATGAEPLFSRSVRDWLKAVFGLGLTASDSATDTREPGSVWLRNSLDGNDSVRGVGMTLDLPPRAVPTLQALVSRRMALPQGLSRAAGPFLVSDAVSLRPLWSVCQPLDDRISPDMPVLVRATHLAVAQTPPALRQHWLAPLHLAVIYRPGGTVNDAHQLFPVAPDAPYMPLLEAPISVTLVVMASDPELIARSLSSLRYQQEIEIKEVLLRGALWSEPDRLDQSRDVAEQVFPGRVRLIARETGSLVDLDQILQETEADHILTLDEAVVFQDSRIFSAMAAELVASDDIASVGCTLMHEDLRGKSTVLQFGSAGLFPAGISLISAPRLTVVEPDTLKALPASTYPVLANTFALCLLRRAALEATAPARAGLAGAGAADLHFGLSSQAAGWRNLCTSVVRAGTTRPPSGRDDIDTFGLDCVLPSTWERLLNSVTVLRELRG